ncbi:MAG: divergent polysaccharide deacetylase family protein [Wenzhouxiangella sp.]
MAGGTAGTRALALALLLATGLAAAADLPRIAIVIDDIGFQEDLDQAVMALDSRVAVAIIPEAPAARQIAQAAGRQQRDVLIHLPLAGIHQDNCHLVLTCIGMGWSAVRMQSHLADALERVEGAVGINNHQGSRFTANAQAVGNLIVGISHLGEQRGQALFVLDSRTSPTTLFEHTALQAGLKATRRHVFLDHSNEPDDIRRAWLDLIDLARRNGSAIAIGHPRVNTIRFLEQVLPELDSIEVRLVPVSTLARRQHEPKPQIEAVMLYSPEP